ncbi:hypothetical protein VTK73DRAFT_9802 [Phialemonium thermophilum]|uniref:Protein kinase domain-containing protein n=1 Tax=Phialemonium thermophilum TaxID=223376 RepID=A0ABR3W069_9PEZI
MSTGPEVLELPADQYKRTKIDPDKPPLPYRAGLQLRIKRHIPPPPFGIGYFQEPTHPHHLSWDELDQFSTPSEYCLQRRPPRETRSHRDQSIHTLDIVEEIATGDHRGAQIVACRTDLVPDRIVAAKIYDPLYYNFPDVDPVYQSDADYSCEAFAYRRLEIVGVDGLHVPAYYGSWTFEMPFAREPVRMRAVCMILMERLPGPSVYALLKSGHFVDSTEGWPPNSVEGSLLNGKAAQILVTKCRIAGEEKELRLNLRNRLNVLRKSMELYTILLVLGVKQRDLAARNIVVTNVDEAGDLGVAIADFSIACVLGTSISKDPMLTTWPSPAVEARFEDNISEWVPELGTNRYDEEYKFGKWVSLCWPRGRYEESDP